MTRAALAALQGDLGAALSFHPLVFVVAPALGGYFLAFVLDLVRPLAWLRDRSAARWTSGVGILFAAVLCGVWMARFAGALGGPVPTDPWFW
jgi:hypothetical protein